MNRLIASLSLVACFGGSVLAEEPAPKERQLLFSLRVCQGDPLGDEARGTLKTLASPNVATMEKRPFSLVSGGELAVRDVNGGTQNVFVGTSLEGKPGIVTEGKVPVDLTLSITTGNGSDAGLARFETEKVRVICSLKLGQMKRIRIGKDGDRQTWLEITVEDVHQEPTERTARNVIASPLYAR